MTYQITGLSPDIAKAFEDASAEKLSALGAVRMRSPRLFASSTVTPSGSVEHSGLAMDLISTRLHGLT